MFKKISLKLIIAVSISISVLIGIYAWVFIHSQSQTLLQETEHKNSELSETIKSSTRFDMLTNNWPHLHQIIKTIGEQPGIMDVRIFNKEGTVIYSPKEEHIGVMVDKKAEACFTCHVTDEPLQKLSISDRTRIFETENGRVMGSINPIYNETSCYEADCHAHSPEQTVLGVLDITVSLNPIDERIASTKIEMLIFTVITIILISLVLWLFVKLWIDKPVNELVEATKIVGSGNLNYSIEGHSDDELGTLARSFNNMTKKMAEARLQLFQSDKMASLGRLAAGVAHEINNPLTGILTYSSFLLKRTKNQPEFQEDLAVIVRETKRSREIVKGLLDFARQSVPKKNNANINNVIDRALSVIENQLSINHIKLTKNFDGKIPPVVIDENQMQQVFINLIVNSIHAISKENGSVLISTGLMSLAPFGLVQIKSALCPKGHSMIDENIKVNGMPTIRVQARVDNREGFINLDPVYGKTRHNYGIKLDSKSVVELSCPKCAASLLDKKQKCPVCGGPVYTFEVSGKGIFRGCAIKGCEWQHWKQIEEEGPKEYLEIKVEDNGCGIPKENLSKIFDPFFTTKGQKGTGLGLAVIWGIIDNHDGRITVDSEAGKGTTFTIRLPVARGNM